MSRRSFQVLPGFNLTLGYTLFYLSIIVLIPLSALTIGLLPALLGSRGPVHPVTVAMLPRGMVAAATPGTWR